MKTEALSINEAALSGFTHRIQITHADLTAAVDATQTIEMINVLPGTIVDRAALKLVTPFKDSADAAAVVTKILIGDGGDTDRFLASNTAGTGVELNENGTEIDVWINPVAASTAGLATAPYAYVAADTIDALFTAPTSGKSHLQLDTGEVHIFLRIVNLNQLSARIV